LIPNIITLTIWIIVAILSFITPKERVIPNWLIGCMGIVVIIMELGEILSKLK
jgi:hypothetical protein